MALAASGPRLNCALQHYCAFFYLLLGTNELKNFENERNCVVIDKRRNFNQLLAVACGPGNILSGDFRLDVATTPTGRALSTRWISFVES
jgi:hypothetical protein